MFKLMNNNTTLKPNITSYFLNILASPDELTRNTTGGPITNTINHPGITKNRLRTVERTWNMINKFEYMEQQYTGENITDHFGKTYL